MCSELALIRIQHQTLVWVFAFKYTALDAEHQLFPIKGPKNCLCTVHKSTRV